MAQALKDAAGICKTIMRNGYDAYVINAKLQKEALRGGEQEVDIASDVGLDELQKLFPGSEASSAMSEYACLRQGEAIFRFYPADTCDGSHPEEGVAKLTPRLLKRFEEDGSLPFHLACPYVPRTRDAYEGFEDLASGVIKLAGIPDETLRQDYLRAVRALRYSANYGLPIEENTWISILRGARRVLDYVSITDIVDEWRKVEAENMAAFVALLYESMILHGLLPEIAAMARIRQMKNETETESVFEHTLEVMRRYPEELPYDWYGTLACLFHDVGKLFTAEYFEGGWHFFQHHRVGAKVTRKLLIRLGFLPEEIDLVCKLVRNHMRFHFMMTDRGLRRFKTLDEYPRLIEMVRADIKARNGSYREFNQNLKLLQRTELPEEMLEPLLNGRQIMQYTGLKPGPGVGLIRDALLKAQITGDVVNEESAIEFVKNHVSKELA